MCPALNYEKTAGRQLKVIFFTPAPIFFPSARQKTNVGLPCHTGKSLFARPGHRYFPPGTAPPASMGRTAGFNILFLPRCPIFARYRPARQESHGAGLSCPVYREGREKPFWQGKK